MNKKEKSKILITKKLIKQIKKGDENAFEKVVDLYHKSVYMIVTKYLNNQDDAEDVTQNVFIKLWQNINLFTERKGNFSAWFIRLVYNEIKSFLRVRSRYRKRIVNDVDFVYKQTLSSTVTLECEIIRVGKILNEDEYFILVSKIIYGLSYTELADIISSNKYQCKITYLKALKQVEKYLNNLEK